MSALHSHFQSRALLENHRNLGHNSKCELDFDFRSCYTLSRTSDFRSRSCHGLAHSSGFRTCTSLGLSHPYNQSLETAFDIDFRMLRDFCEWECFRWKWIQLTPFDLDLRATVASNPCLVLLSRSSIGCGSSYGRSFG